MNCRLPVSRRRVGVHQPGAGEPIVWILGATTHGALCCVPSSEVTVTTIPSKRSGSSSVDPSIAANTLVPNSSASPAPNVPVLNVSLNEVSGPRVRSVYRREPLVEPKRFVFPEMTSPAPAHRM